MYKVLAVGVFAVFVSGCENPFSSGRTRHTLVDFSRYQTVLQHGNPFGIVSLSMQGEPVGFSHPDLPLGDWEWFWYDADGKTNERKHFKLLDTKWSDPKIETDAETAELFYEKSAILIRDWSDPKIEMDAETTELFYEKKNTRYCIENVQKRVFEKLSSALNAFFTLNYLGAAEETQKVAGGISK